MLCGRHSRAPKTFKGLKVLAEVQRYAQPFASFKGFGTQLKIQKQHASMSDSSCDRLKHQLHVSYLVMFSQSFLYLVTLDLGSLQSL